MWRLICNPQGYHSFKYPIQYESLYLLPPAQHITHGLCAEVIPPPVTHCTPRVLVEYFHSALLNAPTFSSSG